MKRRIAAVLALAALVLTRLEAAGGCWMPIAFTNLAGRGPLTNFPVLVKFTTANTAGYAGFLRPADGYDLRFWTNSTLAGSALNYEIEAWSTSGTSFVWVQVPRLTNNAAIWASWGDASASNQMVCTTNGAVWTEGFTAVWHLSETNGNHRDATGNGYTGAPQNGLMQNTNGIIDGADWFDGADDHIRTAADNSPVSGTNSFALSTWIKSGTAGRWIMQQRDGGLNGEYALGLTGGGQLYYWDWDGATRMNPASVQTVTDNQWHHVAFVRNGSNGALYIDGSQDGTVTAPPLNINSTLDFAIGRDIRDNTSNFSGLMDEVRVAHSAHSADWVWACWMNQGVNHDAFAHYGPLVSTAIVNLPATDVRSAQATLNAMLYTEGTSYYATVYWGQSDGGTSATAWAHSQSVGFYTNTIAAVSCTVTTDISPTRTNYFTWRVTNGAASAWASPSLFFGGVPPTVTASGATPGITSVALGGTLAGTPATVITYWGPSDGGTNSSGWDSVRTNGAMGIGSFSTTASNLTPGASYTFRCHATNGLGESWSDAVTFRTLLNPIAFAYGLPISFTNLAGRGPLTNFPALVKLTASNTASYAGFLRPADGYDLRFWSTTGVPLNYEIERFDTNGTSSVWVQVPLLSQGGSIWASWGDTNAAGQLACTTNGAVWSADYQGVWHLGSNFTDSGTNRYVATNGGATDTAGQVGRARSFDGTSQFVATPLSIDQSSTNSPVATFSAWVYPTDNSGGRHHVISSDNGGFDWSLLREGGNWWIFTGESSQDTGTTVDLQTWQHLVAEFIPGTGVKFYKNGVETLLPFIDYDGSANNISIGRNPGFGELFAGRIDEVEISTTLRSPDWVWACWMNQGANHSAFVAYGDLRGYRAPPILNRPPTAVRAAQATLNAMLYAECTSYYATVYWGQSDGGTSATAWAHSQAVGYYANTSTVVSCTATTGIVGQGTNYFTWRATNADYSAWAPRSAQWTPEREWSGASADSFWATTNNWVGDNVPDTAGESALFAGQGAGAVDLSGHSYTLGPLTFASGDYSLTDTNAVPGALTVSTLVNIAGSNSIGVGLTVSGTVEVAGGKLTLRKPESISAGQLRLNGGALSVEAATPAMTGTPVSVAADSSVGAASGTNTAALGALTVSNNATLTTAAGSPVGFLNTTLPATATAVGFNTVADAYLTQSGGLDASGAAVTVTKQGTGNLVLSKGGSNLGSATFNIQTGALVGVHADAFGAAALNLNGGELKLSSPGSDITYAKDVSVAQDGTLTAGMAGGGVAGPLTNTLSGDITFTGTQTLTNRATDGYVLRLGGQIVGNGTLNVAAGTVIVDDPSFNAVALSGGALTVYSNLTVNALTQSSGTCTMAGSSRDLTVVNSLTLAGALSFSGGQNLAISGATATLNNGANVTYDKPLTAGTITIDGGAALNLGTNALNAGALTWNNGGTLTCGDITASTSMSFWPERTIANRLLGAGAVYIGDPENNVGYVELTGTNAYTGKTQIRRAILRAKEGVGLPDNSLLSFRASLYDYPCALETSGTFTRSIGLNPSEVYWDGGGYGGGFSARGGNLKVTLEGGAALDWSSGTLGFNNRDVLMLNYQTSDSMVELTNPINLNAATRYIQAGNNPSVKTDFVRLSGVISGNGAWDSTQLRFNVVSANNFYNALVELTGKNTYSQRTLIDYAAVYAVDGVGLPAPSLLYFEGNDAWEEAILLSRGTFNRLIGHDAPGQVYWGWPGGFAARGGPLTVTLEGGAQLDWGDPNTGFNGQWLQMGSMYADNVVDLTNSISLGANRPIIVFDNLDTDGDVARLSGVISGAYELRKYGNDTHRAGTLWLSGTNTFSGGLFLDQGAIRAVHGVGLPAASRLYFEGDNADIPCVLESSGTFTRNIGNSAGNVYWGTHGGFAAWGGKLDVNLGGGIELQFDSGSSGFNNMRLHLGSRSADSVVELKNAIDLNANWRYISLFDNPYKTTDFAVMSGNIRNGYLMTLGDGLLKLTGINTFAHLSAANTTTVRINGVQNGMTWIYTEENQAATLGGAGTINSTDMEIRRLGALAPGDGAGTLTTAISSAQGLRMFTNSTYDWELGPAAADTVKQTGNLTLDAGWTLRLSSAGGTPLPTRQYDLFTYTGSFAGSGVPSVIDASRAPPDWALDRVRVLHDEAGRRIYLTGLYTRRSAAMLVVQ